MDQSTINLFAVILLSCILVSICCCCCVQSCLVFKLIQSIKELSKTQKQSFQSNLLSSPRLNQLSTIINAKNPQSISQPNENTNQQHNSVRNYSYKAKSSADFDGNNDNESQLETPLPQQTLSGGSVSSSTHSIAHLIPITSPPSRQSTKTKTPQSITSGINQSSSTYTTTTVPPGYNGLGHVHNGTSRDIKRYEGRTDRSGTQTPTLTQTSKYSQQDQYGTYSQIPLFPTYNMNGYRPVPIPTLLQSSASQESIDQKEYALLPNGPNLPGVDELNTYQSHQGLLSPSQMLQAALIIQMNSYLSKQQNIQHPVNNGPTTALNQYSIQSDDIVYKTDDDLDGQEMDKDRPETSNGKSLRNVRFAPQDGLDHDNDHEPDSNIAEYTTDTRNKSKLTMTMTSAIDDIDSFHDRYHPHHHSGTGIRKPKLEYIDTTRATVKAMTPDLSNYLKVENSIVSRSGREFRQAGQGTNSNRQLELKGADSLKTVLSKTGISNNEQVSVIGSSAHSMYGRYGRYSGKKIKKYVKQDSIDPRAELAEQLADIDEYQVEIDLGNGYGMTEIDIPPSTVASNDIVTSVTTGVNAMDRDRYQMKHNTRKHDELYLSNLNQTSASESSTVLNVEHL